MVQRRHAFRVQTYSNLSSDTCMCQCHSKCRLVTTLMGQKRQNISWWSNVQSISRCVAAYHDAFGASEHDACHTIREDISGYACALKRGLPNSADTSQFLGLLHRAIENRSFNMAQRKIIILSFDDHLLILPIGQRLDEETRRVVADVLEQCLEITQADYETLQADMRTFRNTQ